MLSGVKRAQRDFNICWVIRATATESDRRHGCQAVIFWKQGFLSQIPVASSTLARCWLVLNNLVFCNTVLLISAIISDIKHLHSRVGSSTYKQYARLLYRQERQPCTRQQSACSQSDTIESQHASFASVWLSCNAPFVPACQACEGSTQDG